MDKTERIALGSGKLYTITYDDIIPEDSVIETEENRLGDVKNGANLEYTADFYTATDDLGLVSKTVLTGETAVLKSGVLTWNTDIVNLL